MPFYSIEAWTYQNTAVSVRLCNARYGGRDAAVFAEWAADPGRLDEVERVKEVAVLKGKHNLELASDGFPAETRFRAGKSFFFCRVGCCVGPRSTESARHKRHVAAVRDE